MEIPELIRRKLDDHNPIMNPQIEEIVALDEQVKWDTMKELNMTYERIHVNY